MAETVIIDRRFRGPPDSAHGGYTCGVLARRIDSPVAEVTLRAPPPLGREMVLARGRDGGGELRDGDSVVAEGRPLDELELELPEPVDLADAEAARDGSPLHDQHPFPMCFVCGPERASGDGLRVICGAVGGRDVVASPWETDDTLPRDGDVLAPEMVWAALDCPSGNALMKSHEAPFAVVLGRIAARIDAELRPGETYIAVAWPIDRDGRKHYNGSAIFSRDGEPLACARATWIELKGDSLGAQT